MLAADGIILASPVYFADVSAQIKALIDAGKQVVLVSSGAIGMGVLVAIIVYTASFMMSWGPICWVLISEIFPNRIRGRAVAVAAEHQAKGIGSAMIEEGLGRCGMRELAYAVVVGNPDYYSRFGFGPMLQPQLIDQTEIKNFRIMRKLIRLICIGMKVVTRKRFALTTEMHVFCL